MHKHVYIFVKSKRATEFGIIMPVSLGILAE